MNTFMEIAAGLLAAFGQWLKSKPQIDNRIAVVLMMLVGLGFYAVPNHPPDTLAEFWPWLDQGKLWVLALPGLASAIGTFFPGLKTQQ